MFPRLSAGLSLSSYTSSITLNPGSVIAMGQRTATTAAPCGTAARGGGASTRCDCEMLVV
jgi:hypothetical protein